MIRAVVDRIVDGMTAVILVGDEEQEYDHPASELPRGVGEGSVLRVEISGETITAIKPDLEDTDETLRRIRRKLDELRRRGRKA